MDKLAEVDRPARPASIPSDISFRTATARRIAAAVRPGEPRAERELPEPHLALRARRRGEPAHARARTATTRRATRRSTTGSPSPPTATIKGKADLFILDDGGVTAARRHSGHDRGSALDQRRHRDRRARRRSRPRRRRHQRRRALWWGDDGGPRGRPIRRDARRRLFKVGCDDGTTTEVGPTDLSVWEFDLLGDDAAVALVSDDAERARLVSRAAGADRLRVTRASTILHRSHWQLQAPAASPSRQARRLPRRLVERPRAGRERDPHPRSRDRQVSTSLAPRRQSNITTLPWRDEESLWFAGWSQLGSIYGVVRLDGTVVWIDARGRDHRPEQFPRRASRRRRTRRASPPSARRSARRRRSCSRRSSDATWTPVTQLNAGDRGGLRRLSRGARASHWKGTDGLALEALRPAAARPQAGPLPTIVDIHGGPSWAAKYAFNPGYALPFAAAGYAVFLPNYRGNTGWGQEFARLNIGDPGGAEFDDILAGIDRCVAEGFADPDRLGVTGASYGGYMTAWAVATHRPLQGGGHGLRHLQPAEQPLFLQSRFPRLHQRRPAHARSATATSRSTARRCLRLDKPTTPTLILHGERGPLHAARPGAGILCRALRARRAEPSWSSIRARAMASRSASHRLDAWRRTVAWFDRYLGVGAVSGSDLVRFILWRLAVAVPLLLIISFGVFALVHLAPGDPVRALLGTRPSDPETLADAPRALSSRTIPSSSSTASGSGRCCRAISAARSTATAGCSARSASAPASPSSSA